MSSIDQYGPVGAGPLPPAPTPKRPADTVWAWLLVLLPLLQLIPVFIYLDQMRQRTLELLPTLVDSSHPDVKGIVMFELGIIFNPWYLAIFVLGWAVYGLTVWFAFRDAGELAARGFMRRFHWAWSFLSSLVYVIGRHAVLRQQGGSGAGPVAATVTTMVLGAVGGLVWSVVFMAQIVVAVSTTVPLR